MADPHTARTYPHGVPTWIDLEVQDVDAALAFYGGLFGWRFEEKLPPGAPGFADVVAGVVASDGPARWSVAFAVADRNESAAEAERTGATVLETEDTEWSKSATIRDPFGAELVLAQFDPPEEFLEAEAQS